MDGILILFFKTSVTSMQSARNTGLLFTILEYIKWNKFLNVIAKVKKAFSGQVGDDHFPRLEKMVEMDL